MSEFERLQDDGQAAQRKAKCDLNSTSVADATEWDSLGELRNAIQRLQCSGDELSFSDLENVESWLNQVYGLLCVEPDRPWMSTAILPQTLSGREPSSDDLKPCVRHRLLPSCPSGHNLSSFDYALKPAVSTLPVEATVENDGKGTVHIGSETKMSTSQTVNLVILMHSVDCEVGTAGVSSRVVSHNLDSILDELMTISEELEEKSSHATDAIARVKSIVSSLHCGESTQIHLQTHLASLSGILDPLKGRLSRRIAQLKFEKIQKAVLDELVEVQGWIDSKLNNAQAQRHETEELIVIAGQYRTQLEMKWKDLDTVLGQLVLFCPEDVPILDHTIQQLRNVYHEIISMLPNGPVQLADVSSNNDVPYNCEIYFRIPILIGLFSLICTVIVICLESVAHVTH